MKYIAAVLAALVSAPAALAEQAATPQQGAITYVTEDTFDDVIFGVQSAIEGKGLVIDATSHIGEMLERTRGATGSDVVLFDKADSFGFCSASLSRKVMEADFTNIRFCPYQIYVYVRPDKPDETVVGFQSYPEGPMQEVQALLDSIAREAVGLD